MSHSTVAACARDPRLQEMARAYLGSGATPFRATLFDKSAGSNWLVVWHQDTALPLAARHNEPGWGPWSTKNDVVYAHAPAWVLEQVVALRLHLEDSASDNGPLCVIPGSHREGVLNDEEVFAYARAHEAVECIVPEGGVLAMRPLLIHSSQKSTSDRSRRVLHLEYAASLDLAPGIRLAIA